MTSPNEPEQSGTGQRPGQGDASPDVPPWQSRPESFPADPPPERPPAAPPAKPAPVGAVRVDPRRYVTGLAAPDLSGLAGSPKRPEPEPPRPPAESRSERTEVAALEALPSELPDLSGPLPRPQRRPAPGPGPVTAPTARIQVGGRPRGPVRASMQIRRIDPWSTCKISGVLSVALFFVWMIAVAFLYLVLGAMGVWSKLNSNVGDLLTGGGAGGDIVSVGSIFGGAALIGLVNIVLLTGMATAGAYIYNLSTDIVGGVEVTLADLD